MNTTCTWCHRVSPGLNILLHNNNTMLLINVVPFKVICLGLHMVTAVLRVQFNTFYEVQCLKLSKCMAWIMGTLLNLLTFNTTLSFWKINKSHGAKSGEEEGCRMRVILLLAKNLHRDKQSGHVLHKNLVAIWHKSIYVFNSFDLTEMIRSAF
jgi:hypothetical protein